MANPLQALGDLNRIKQGGDPVSIRTGHEASEKVDQAIELLGQATQDLQGSMGASEGRLNQAIATLGIGLNQALQGYIAAETTRQTTVITKAMPVLDVSPVIEQIKALPQYDDGEAQKKLDLIQAAIEAIPEADLTDILLSQRLLAKHIEALEFPATDLAPILERLGRIESDIAELQKPREYEFDIERINSMPMSPIKKVTARQV